MHSIDHLEGNFLFTQIQDLFPEIYKKTGSRVEFNLTKVPFGWISIM